MTDIVERLHKRADALGENWLNEAADEIERLRKENFALAANQCHAPYSDEYGNHRCRYQGQVRMDG